MSPLYRRERVGGELELEPRVDHSGSRVRLSLPVPRTVTHDGRASVELDARELEELEELVREARR